MSQARSFFDSAVRKVRICRTFVVHVVRAKLGLYENQARDRMINGTRADQDALAKSMCELSKQHARTVKQLNSALTRLDYYEKHVPWLGDLRRDFDYEQAIGEDAAIEERVRLEHGVIAELTKV